jgi:hypothetical protein
LAKNVLAVNTKGCKNHLQISRFKNSDNPIHVINQYLEAVYQESLKRENHFNKDKFNICHKPVALAVTRRQIEYETRHLLKKLKTRILERYNRLQKEADIELHPLFVIMDGEIEEW